MADNELVRLPAKLSDLPALEALNARLRASAVKLDWSEVTDATDRALAVLLGRLELDAHADALGIDTVPEELQERVAAALTSTPAPPAKKKPKAGKGKAPAAAVWKAPSAADGPSSPEPPDEMAPPPVLKIATAVELRDMLVDKVVADLLGPAQGPTEEVVEGRVSERYLIGMLAPKRTRIEPQDEATAEDGGGDDDAAAEPTAPPRESLFPSSFGLSFCVAGDVDAFRATARWGLYRRAQSSTLLTPEGNPRTVWKRTPVEGWAMIPLVEGPIESRPIVPEYPDVLIRGVVRRVGDEWIVSLFLVNDQAEPDKRKEEGWLFQAELIVDDKSDRSILRRRPNLRAGARLDAGARAEIEAMCMIYRDRLEFAVGHGVATHVDGVDTDGERARSVCTRVIPRHDAPQHRPPRLDQVPELAGLVLDMRELGECDAAKLFGKLQALPAAYRAWIEGQARRAKAGADGLSGHLEAAADALKRCRRACERVEEGLQLLSKDPHAARAFQFANRAMWQQRVRGLYAEKVRRGEKLSVDAIDVPANRTWYPFQLAFILLNLPALTRLDHPDRRADDPTTAADLLWFPTGGGKTEAYLGLTAYTLGIRRLQGDIEGRPGQYGVSVLMRYTLRLLTLQQFQRATALICACETIRRADQATWGAEPFRLGLWVGAKTTPNSTEDSAEALKQAHGQKPGAAMGTPAQLKHCPWCGQEINAGRDIVVRPFAKSIGRTLIFCGDKYGTCPFSARQAPHEGIPAIVVDHELYRRLPALVIATVDKFAQMPWNGTVRALFGHVSGYCERHGFRSPELEDADSHPKAPDLPAAKTWPMGPLRPPDLIIQDELHLISGPLGTLTGLYETAVDELCTWEVNGKRVRPKVVASTATIRRARDQVHQLFLREVAVFPPHGLDVRDNFFAVERDLSEHYGRRYIGICAPGRRLKAALIRVYVAFLAAAQQLFNDYGEAADPWMTLVGYFNSLRELAGMVRLVQDDIRARLRDTDQRGLARRRAPDLKELTSRMSSAQIPELLDQLEVPFTRALEARRAAKAERREGEPTPIDVLLATNMVSVGVDVKRLGLMVMSGQPKTTAEYIQATSRVGRSFPGLVCTIYNWARPRDLSHYQGFEHYHQTFYQHVEALSLTPFASRALDRGLSGVLVSLVRLMEGGLNRNADAGAIKRTEAAVKQALKVLRQRAESVTGSKDAGDMVAQMLERRLDRWCSLAQLSGAGVTLAYRPQRGATAQALLRPAGDGPWEDFTCLNSLRDVEPTVPLVLLDDDEVMALGKEAW